MGRQTQRGCLSPLRWVLVQGLSQLQGRPPLAATCMVLGVAGVKSGQGCCVSAGPLLGPLSPVPRGVGACTRVLQDIGFSDSPCSWTNARESSASERQLVWWAGDPGVAKAEGEPPGSSYLQHLGVGAAANRGESQLHTASA